MTVAEFIAIEGNYTSDEDGIYGKLGRALAAWRLTEQQLSELTHVCRDCLHSEPHTDHDSSRDMDNGGSGCNYANGPHCIIAAHYVICQREFCLCPSGFTPTPVAPTDEYWRLRIEKNALTLLREQRNSDGVELATINAMIADVDVRIGRNRCYPSGERHSDACDGKCGKSEMPAKMTATDGDESEAMMELRDNHTKIMKMISDVGHWSKISNEQRRRDADIIADLRETCSMIAAIIGLPKSEQSGDRLIDAVRQLESDSDAFENRCEQLHAEIERLEECDAAWRDLESQIRRAIGASDRA